MQLTQQRRKTPQQNPLAHRQRSVTVSDDASWQVKIGLHQFNSYLSQVKVNAKKTVNISQRKIPAGQCPGTQSARYNQLSCLQFSQMLTGL